MKYIQKKNISLKVYGAVLNNFLNNINIPSVPPILVSGETITNIVEKANIFNEFFAFQCTPLGNNSSDNDIVNTLLYGSSKYSFSTNNKIMSLTVEF